MKSSALLDSIVFQLTPTRTRCDLVITANGKSEKIASGLLNPFLAHLKAAEDQIGKGGYSIVLEPKKQSDVTWFTKGTVESFVRFVSSPEILERVYTIESEILQIQKAISLQNSDDNNSRRVEDLPVKFENSLEGNKPAPVFNDEKAIVLYQPANPESEEDVSIIQAKNSKVQLVQVLEARKSVLQKEQGMAFARAVAAGFDIDNIATLLAFAECFGASRMMDACKNFMNLWKAKHENGQWVEVEATEAMSCRSDMPSTNAAGIVFLGPNESHQGEIIGEKSPSVSDQVPPMPHEYNPGQFPHPMFPPWQMHPQANGMPAFQPYPMQGMPYYQHYMGQSPFFQSPYTPRDDSKLHSGRKTRQRRHSMDSRDLSTELEAQELDGSGTDGDTDEDSSSKKLKNKGGKSSRKKPGTVVIRNINYITSTKQKSSDGDPNSSSDPGTDDEGQTLKSSETKKSKKKGGYSNFKEESMSGQAGDDGNWQAFQSFLLNDAEENNNSTKSSVFAMEGKAHGRKRQSTIGDDSSALGMRETVDVGIGENLDISGDATCMRKSTGDQMLSYGQNSNSRHRDSQKDLQFMETGGRRGAYRRSADTHTEYMINQRENLTDVWDHSLDPVIRNGFKGDTNNRGSSIGLSDESFMVLQRSGSLDQVRGNGRTAIDMDCELPSAPRTDDHTYEPNDLNLMPTREMEDRPSGYDRAMDYEMQAQNNNVPKLNGKKKEAAVDSKGGLRKAVKDQKLKAQNRTAVSTRRPSKLTPAEDARARAEKLRAYKADLQKLKKEKEEEQLKRLEALKIERQKRIAAKSGVNPQSSLPSQQARRQLPKLSPVSQKGSKFSDTEPGSSSPLQRSKLRIISKASPGTSKVSKSGGLSNASLANGNRLIRSASSLRTRKEDKNSPTPDSVTAMSRIRRLSEPKSTAHRNSLGKSRSTEAVSRHIVSEKTEIKKVSTTSNMDKAKSSRLLEGKSRTSKSFETTVERKSTKELSQRLNGKSVPNNEASANKKSRDISPSRDVDDNTVVEKTVVMLEREQPTAPIVHEPEDKIGIQTMHSSFHNHVDKPEEDRAIPSPASPITVIEVDQEKSNCIVKGQTQTHLNEAGKVLPNIPSVDPRQKTYQAPYARVSSLEDPCMAESNYGKAPPANVEMEAVGVQATKVLVSNTQRPSLNDINKVSEADSGKFQGKDSPKGFKRLLMFGKKNSATSERSSIESEKATLNDPVIYDPASNGSDSEVFTVKNLLTQEESSSAGTTPKKSSRPFSLLSHFRSKNSEKKLAS